MQYKVTVSYDILYLFYHDKNATSLQQKCLTNTDITLKERKTTWFAFFSYDIRTKVKLFGKIYNFTGVDIDGVHARVCRLK